MSTSILYQNKHSYTQDFLKSSEHYSHDREIDWLQVEREAEIRLDGWSRLLGYYTSLTRRQQEIIDQARSMQLSGGLR